MPQAPTRRTAAANRDRLGRRLRPEPVRRSSSRSSAGSPRTAWRSSPTPGTCSPTCSGIGLALLAIWFARASPDQRAHVRLPATRDPRRGRERGRCSFGGGRVHPHRGLAAAVGPPEVASGLMLAVALVGLAANAASPRSLLRDAQRDEPQHARRVPRGAWAISPGPAAVIVAAVVIALTGWIAADAVASVAIGAADPAAHLRAAARRDRRPARGDARRTSTWPTSAGTSSRRRASSTATTCTPGRSRRALNVVSAHVIARRRGRPGA